MDYDNETIVLTANIAAPEGGLVKDSPEYNAHLAKVKSLLDEGKFLVFERPHRLIPGVTVLRWATEWKLEPDMEADLVCKNGYVALWDTNYKMHVFNTAEEGHAFIQKREEAV